MKTPDPRCACTKPAAVTYRQRHSWGVGPQTVACLTCAPAPAGCEAWVKFWQPGREAEAVRDAAIARARRAAA